MPEYTFNDKKTVDAFQENLDFIIKENDFHEAYLFSKKLIELLDIANLKISLSEKNLQKYEKMVLIAKFLSLYKLEEQEILDLLDKNFNIIFEINHYNIEERIDHFLLANKYFLDQRDEFKEALRKRLLESKTKITKEDIEINGNKVAPSISNWLRDFRDQFTEEGFFDSLNLNKYSTNSENTLNLSEKEKEKILVLMELYAKLKLSSNSVEGLEENLFIETKDGGLGTIVNGQIEKIPQAVIDIFNEVQRKTGGELYNPHKKNISTSEKVFNPPEEKKSEAKEKDNKKSVEKLLESYKAFEIDLKTIDPIIKSLDKYKNNPDGLFIKFNKNLQEENRDNLLSLVIFICQNKILDKFLKENEKLLTEFKKYLSFKLSADIIKSIMDKSTSPETVSLYLQFLLFKKIKLSPRNSGLFGMHLANIFKKIGQDKYFPLVYGDINLERFVWREVIEENGLIKFK